MSDDTSDEEHRLKIQDFSPIPQRQYSSGAKNTFKFKHMIYGV